MQFLWVAEGDQDYGLGQVSYSNAATMLTNYTLHSHNVTLEYSNGSYFLVDEKLSNTGLSDGLAAPSHLGHFASHLISNIEGRVFTDNSTENLMTYLQQDLSKLALGFTAVITNILTNTLSQSFLGSMIIGRYPFWPIVIFLILLYLLATLAILVFLLAALSIQTEAVTVCGDTPNGERRRSSILKLTQMHLRNPLCLVAALFPLNNINTTR